MPASPEVIAARKTAGIQVSSQICRGCDKDKPADQFRVEWKRTNGLHSHCHECVSHMNRLDRFGVTREQYQEMLIAQHGVCAICKQEERSLNNKGERIKDLAVDHDHATGVVRGLLCANCNKGIGNLGDSVETLLSAAAYLMERGGLEGVM